MVAIIRSVGGGFFFPPPPPPLAVAAGFVVTVVITEEQEDRFWRNDGDIDDAEGNDDLVRDGELGFVASSNENFVDTGELGAECA